MRGVNSPQISQASNNAATEPARIARLWRLTTRRAAASRVAAAVRDMAKEATISGTVALEHSALQVCQQSVDGYSHGGEDDRRSEHFRHLIGTRCGVQQTAQSRQRDEEFRHD